MSGTVQKNGHHELGRVIQFGPLAARTPMLHIEKTLHSKERQREMRGGDVGANLACGHPVLDDPQNFENVGCDILNDQVIRFRAEAPGLPIDDLEKFFVFAEQLEVGDRQGQQPLSSRAGVLEARNALDRFSTGLGQDRAEQGLLALKVVVDRSFRESCTDRDLVDVSAVKALFGKSLGGGLQQAGPPRPKK